MHERLDTARRLQRQAAQEVSRVSCDRPAAAGRIPQKARNSRVASRVPGYFLNLLTYCHYGVGRGNGVGRGLGVGGGRVAVGVAALSP